MKINLYELQTSNGTIIDTVETTSFKKAKEHFKNQGRFGKYVISCDTVNSYDTKDVQKEDDYRTPNDVDVSTIKEISVNFMRAEWEIHNNYAKRTRGH